MSEPDAKSERWTNWRWVLWTILIIAIVPLLYLEENLRGTMMWQGTKKYWEGKGETLDYAKFAPPPVPDEQNLALIPLLALTLDSNGYPTQLALDKAMQSGSPQIEMPKFGNWMAGDLGDPMSWRKSLEDSYKLLVSKAPAPADDLSLFNAIWPVTETLRAESAKRTLYRPPINYSTNPPVQRPFGPLTKSIKMALLMMGNGRLAIDQGKMDVAKEDMRVNFILIASARKDPSLVGGLVAIGVFAINGGIIYRGLARQAWSDAQLAEIEEKVGELNFLNDFQFVMRAEAAMSVEDLPYFKRTSGKDLTAWAGSPGMEGLTLGPGGWWDINAAQIVNFHLEQLVFVDPASRAVDVKKAQELVDKMKAFEGSWRAAYLPWNAWFGICGPSEASYMRKFAHAQVWVDETRIAIALERYRLAHGSLPTKLEVLSPQYIHAVPHDIMDGNPYHYLLNADGTYLLYSIGWNDVDDGGIVVFEADNGKFINDSAGDWVWPMPKK